MKSISVIRNKFLKVQIWEHVLCVRITAWRGQCCWSGMNEREGIRRSRLERLGGQFILNLKVIRKWAFVLGKMKVIKGFEQKIYFDRSTWLFC